MLATRQLVVLVLLGVVLWLAAALLVAGLQSQGWLTGSERVLVYVLVVPGTLPFTFLLRRIGGGRATEAVAIATAAATLCDGVALAWAPGLYGVDTGAAGAVILWGAGVGLALAIIVDRLFPR